MKPSVNYFVVYLGVIILTLVAIPLVRAEQGGHGLRPQYAGWSDPQAPRHFPVF